MSPRGGAAYEPLQGWNAEPKSDSLPVLGGRKRMGRYRALPGVTGRDRHAVT